MITNRDILRKFCVLILSAFMNLSSLGLATANASPNDLLSLVSDNSAPTRTFTSKRKPNADVSSMVETTPSFDKFLFCEQLESTDLNCDGLNKNLVSGYDSSILIKEVCPDHERYEEAIESIKKLFLTLKVFSNASDEVFESFKDEAWTIAEDEFDEKNYEVVLMYKAETGLTRYNMCEKFLNNYILIVDENIKTILRELNPEQREKYEEIYPPQKRKRTF